MTAPLPPLPEPKLFADFSYAERSSDVFEAYTAEQMREYAQAARAAVPVERKELSEMREHGDADDAVEAQARLQRHLHDAETWALAIAKQCGAKPRFKIKNENDDSWVFTSRALADFARAILALRAPVEDAWQPIETAPKDGRPVLLAFPELPGWMAGAWRGAWSHVGHEWSIHTPLMSEGKSIVATGLPMPTHWQPLPPLGGQTGSDGVREGGNG